MKNIICFFILALIFLSTSHAQEMVLLNGDVVATDSTVLKEYTVLDGKDTIQYYIPFTPGERLNLQPDSILLDSSCVQLIRLYNRPKKAFKRGMQFLGSLSYEIESSIVPNKNTPISMMMEKEEFGLLARYQAKSGVSLIGTFKTPLLWKLSGTGGLGLRFIGSSMEQPKTQAILYTGLEADFKWGTIMIEHQSRFPDYDFLIGGGYLTEVAPGFSTGMKAYYGSTEGLIMMPTLNVAINQKKKVILSGSL